MMRFTSHLLTLFVLACTLLACSSSKDAPMQNDTPNTIVGKWQLDRMVAGWTNTVTPGDQLDFESFYEFKADGTFRKYYSTGEEASGTYLQSQKEDGLYLELSYPSPSDIIISCTPNQEYLQIMESGELYGGALPCDGPGVYYTYHGKL